jgi:hypothetical protein
MALDHRWPSSWSGNAAPTLRRGQAQSIYIMALLGARQQDIGQQDSVMENVAII